MLLRATLISKFLLDLPEKKKKRKPPINRPGIFEIPVIHPVRASIIYHVLSMTKRERDQLRDEGDSPPSVTDSRKADKRSRAYFFDLAPVWNFKIFKIRGPAVRTIFRIFEKFFFHGALGNVSYRNIPKIRRVF